MKRSPGSRTLVQ